MENKIDSTNISSDETVVVKRRGRPNKDVCLWKDNEHKNNYFRKYFENARVNTVMVDCECGKQYSLVYKYKHMHSKYHLRFLELKHRFSSSPNALGEK